jgi:quercetin 2,3-dioxygenase
MGILRIPAETRGLTQLKWLTSYHSFSFGDYYDSKKMGFGKLRVLNDDTVEASGGFPLHFHDNMEIVTFVLKGSLEHKDSTGGHGVLKAGQMQRMTAGKGINHSEFNPSKTEPVHFLQIWITPQALGLTPEYEQKEFISLLRPNQLSLIVSPQKSGNTLFIHQDVRFHLARVESGASVNYPISSAGKGVYLFLIEGEVQIGREMIKSRDAAAITDEKEFSLTAKQLSQLLFIETPLL